MGAIVVEVFQACVVRGGQEILHNVSFTLKGPGLVGVVGPNGGGKSTLLQFLLGLLPPSHGYVKIFGAPPQKMLKKMGYVPQRLPFDRKFPVSVKELIMTGLLSRLNFWGRYSTEQQEKGFFWLEKMGLQDLADRSIGTLSGGQLQRALIARALIADPDLLFLDEALEGVDQSNQEFIYSYLKQLSKTKTILLVTHDFASCRALADRLLVVQGGVEEVSTARLCDHFSMGLYHAKSEKSCIEGEP
jgi:zinc transport system ATP-binding protein